MVTYSVIEKVLHANEDYKYLVEEIKNNYAISEFYLDESIKFKDPINDINSEWSKFFLPNDSDTSFTYDNRFISFMVDFINDINQDITVNEAIDTINYVVTTLLVFREIYNLIAHDGHLSIMSLADIKVKVYKNLHFLEFCIEFKTKSKISFYISLLIESIGEMRVKHNLDFPLVMFIYNKDKTNKIFHKYKITEITKDSISALINMALDKFM